MLYTLCLWHRGYGDIPFHRGQRPAFAPPEGVTAFQKKWCIRCGKPVAPGAKARQGTARRALLDIGSRRRDRPHGPRFRVYRVAIPRRPFGASAPDQGTWAPPSRKPPGARRRKRHLSFRAIRRVPAPRAPLGLWPGANRRKPPGGWPSRSLRCWRRRVANLVSPFVNGGGNHGVPTRHSLFAIASTSPFRTP